MHARNIVEYCIKIVSLFAGAVICYLTLLNFPMILFPCTVSAHNLTLYSDRPFDSEDGEMVLDRVYDNLSQSPLYSPDGHYSAYICNSDWRRTIFFRSARHASALAYTPLSTNVFLRGGVVAENLLVTESGRPDMFNRSLDHFITHEITHVLTCDATGWWRYRALPVWIREGYAEYVGDGGTFDYDTAVEAFLANDPIMNQPVFAPYQRFRLLVTWLLNEKHWTPMRLLASTMSMTDAETMLRTELSHTGGR